MKIMNLPPQFLTAGMITVAVAVFLPTLTHEITLQPEVAGQLWHDNTALPIAAASKPILRPDAAVFETPAHAALAVDLKTGRVLYEKNAYVRRPTASLGKLMTALVAVAATSTEAVVTVEKQALDDVPQPRMGLRELERIRVLDLLKGMLIASANDAAVVLSRTLTATSSLFIAEMNQFAQRLNLNNTHFQNAAGFDDPGQYSTARDLATLSFAFLKDPQLASIVQIPKATVTSEDSTVRHWLQTSNRLLSDPEIIGIKTGYTENASGNLILLSRIGEDSLVLTIVLGSENREEDSVALLDWLKTAYEF